MEVFTGSSDHTTNTEPQPVELKLKDDAPIQPTEILESVFNAAPLPYTSAAAATINHKQKRRLQRKINKLISKSEFVRPNLTHLCHELDTIDISTNTIFKTISHTIPIQEKILHPTLGILSQPHPDIKNRIELTSIQPGTSSHRHIKSWKRRLKGTIITAIDGQPVTSKEDMIQIVVDARKSGKRNLKFEFGSLAGFAMNCNGIPTLQADQLNVIAHHICSIQTQQNIWDNPEEWPDLIDSDEVHQASARISKLKRNQLKMTSDWESFRASEWKQLNRYHKVGMFGNPIAARYGMTILPWVWTHLYEEGKGSKDQTNARGTCNGSSQFFNANNLGKTFAACLEQPTHRLTWAISAALGLICKGYI